MTITWAAGPRGGTLGATSSTTGANGVARCSITVDATAGVCTVTASSPGVAPIIRTITQI